MLFQLWVRNLVLSCGTCTWEDNIDDIVYQTTLGITPDGLNSVAGAIDRLQSRNL